MLCTEYHVLKRVLLCSPKYLDISTPINVIAQKHETVGVDIEQAQKEHDELVNALEENGAEVCLVIPYSFLPYQVNTRDLGIFSPKGIILGRFFQPLRWAEHRPAEDLLFNRSIPIIDKIDRGLFEGGDFVYLDENTALVGMGARTNRLGFKMLETILYDTGLDLIPVDFPLEFLHLDMICNVVGEKVAIVCSSVLPESLTNLFNRKNFELIEISKKEVLSHSANLLSLDGEKIISHKKAGRVNEQLKALGFNLEILDLKEVLKSGGGPRCMTFPLLRDPK